ncbi:VOC family protein [Corynebacterium otitidis]|uniref:VOC family protein n=1 Tax=Corynebacterium otitidis TaxID=29321 RepID=UPI000627EB3F|nr:VOC family protein [Corynebacterium otitidis]KKO83078.1 hypothetical protein AAV33_08495 [Corynebacterium otitidis]
MPAFRATDGLPFWLDLLPADAEASAGFFKRVLGWDVGAPGEGGLRAARRGGLPVAGLREAEPGRTPSWVVYFHHPDLDGAAAAVERLGGRLLSPILPAGTPSGGDLLLAADPQGGVFGLMAPGGEDFVAAGEPGTPVWHELPVAGELEATARFYGELLGWDVSVDDPGGGAAPAFAVAAAEGAPFAGFFPAPAGLPEGPGWAAYIGVSDASAAADAARAAGGRVLDGPVESPLGRLAKLADPTGAVLSVAEVPEPEFPGEEPEEAEDVLGAADRAAARGRG